MKRLIAATAMIVACLCLPQKGMADLIGVSDTDPTGSVANITSIVRHSWTGTGDNTAHIFDVVFGDADDYGYAFDAGDGVTFDFFTSYAGPSATISGPNEFDDSVYSEFFLVDFDAPLGAPGQASGTLDIDRGLGGSSGANESRDFNVDALLGRSTLNGKTVAWDSLGLIGNNDVYTYTYAVPEPTGSVVIGTLCLAGLVWRRRQLK